MEEKKFLYADKREQLRRTNRFLSIGYTVYYLYIMVMLGYQLCL